MQTGLRPYRFETEIEQYLSLALDRFYVLRTSLKALDIFGLKV